MSPGRIAVGRGRAIRVLLALIAVSACLGAVAYAATRPQHRAAGLAGSKPVGSAPQQGVATAPGKTEEQRPQVRLIEYPEAISVVADPQFRFHVPPRTQRPLPSAPGSPESPGQPERLRRFQCGLDGGGWRSCISPYHLSALAPGRHTLAVRALTRAGRPGPVTGYAWRRAEPSHDEAQVVDPKPFSIELGGQLEDLYPGFPPQQVPVLLVNPNSLPIEVIRLTVTITGDTPDCAAENFELTQSSASPATAVSVPPGGATSLPTATVSAPTIRMLNLGVNQDACQGTEVPLAFDGEAHG